LNFLVSFFFLLKNEVFLQEISKMIFESVRQIIKTKVFHSFDQKIFWIKPIMARIAIQI